MFSGLVEEFATVTALKADCTNLIIKPEGENQ